jgi:uncharacterized repeat protein (TIGR01451 family)
MHARPVGFIHAALIAGMIVSYRDAQALGQAANRAQAWIEVQQKMPDRIAPGETVPIEVVIRNTGTAAAESVTVNGSLPTGFELVDAIPTPDRVRGALVWPLGVVEPNGQRVVRMRLVTRDGSTANAELRSVVTVTYETSVQSTVVAAVQRPALALDVAAPVASQVGQPAALRITVRNPGATPLQEVLLQTVLPAGLAHPGGNDLETDVGTLEPGQTREITLAVTPTRAGEFRNRISALARGVVPVEREVHLQARDLKIGLSANGPRLLYQDWVGSFEVVLRNEGTEAISQVALVAGLPDGLMAVRASDNGIYDARNHSLRWSLGNLRPGETRTLVWNGTACAIGDQVCNVELAAGERLRKSLRWETKVVKAPQEPTPPAGQNPKLGPVPLVPPPTVPTSASPSQPGASTIEVKWHPVVSPSPLPLAHVELPERGPEPSTVPRQFAAGWR